MREIRLFVVLMTFVFSSGIACKEDKLIIGKNEKGSYYAIYKYGKTNSDSAVIYAKVRSNYDESKLSAFVRVNDRVLHPDKHGYFKITLPPGKYRIEGGALLFNTMQLPPLHLSAGDNFDINFFVTLNTGPYR